MVASPEPSPETITRNTTTGGNYFLTVSSASGASDPTNPYTVTVTVHQPKRWMPASSAAWIVAVAVPPPGRRRVPRPTRGRIKQPV
jgi:hypothetical protein